MGNQAILLQPEVSWRTPSTEFCIARSAESPYLHGKELPVEADLPLGIVKEVSYAESSFPTNGNKVT